MKIHKSTRAWSSMTSTKSCSQKQDLLFRILYLCMYIYILLLVLSTANSSIISFCSKTIYPSITFRHTRLPHSIFCYLFVRVTRSFAIRLTNKLQPNMKFWFCRKTGCETMDFYFRSHSMLPEILTCYDIERIYRPSYGLIFRTFASKLFWPERECERDMH